MFTVINNKYNSGFKMTFENGWTISVQFGTRNYCENRGFGIDEFDTDVPKTSTNAEIAIWDSNNEWFNFGGNIVMGWVSTNEVAEWIKKVSKFKPVSKSTVPENYN